MKAIAYDPCFDRFSVTEQPIPEPGPHDVRVRVLACGLNPVDAKIDQWHAMAPGMGAHWVPGLDISGEIVAIGDAVTSWSPGDRVLYHGDMFRPHGGFAEYAIHDARTLIAHPDAPPHVAASTPCAGWTAWRALVDRLRARGASAIFIAGGAGGVGGFAIQVARHLGIANIITTASASNHEYVRALGATTAIDYCYEDVLARVMALTGGEGVPLALDTVGGDNDIVTASVLGYEGRMVELVRVVRPELYPEAFMKGLGFDQLSLGSGHRHGDAARAALVRAGLMFSDLVASGDIKPPRINCIDMRDVGAALKDMRRQRTVGKSS